MDSNTSPLRTRPTGFTPNYLARASAGAAGLVMAAILAAAMSNLSAALNSLASTTIMDFLPSLGPARPARGAAVAAGPLEYRRLGLVLFGIGLLARHWGSVLEAGLSIASVDSTAACWAFFLMGVLTRRGAGTSRHRRHAGRPGGHDLHTVLHSGSLDLVRVHRHQRHLPRRIRALAFQKGYPCLKQDRN